MIIIKMCPCFMCDQGRETGDELVPMCQVCNDGTCMGSCPCLHMEECPDDCQTNHAE